MSTDTRTIENVIHTALSQASGFRRSAAQHRREAKSKDVDIAELAQYESRARELECTAQGIEMALILLGLVDSKLKIRPEILGRTPP